MRESVGLFFAMSTQWIWASAGMGGAFRTGLNYAALAPTASLTRIVMTDRHFDDIRTLERAAIEAWSKRR